MKKYLTIRILHPLLFLLIALAASNIFADEPVTGKTARYCNPLPMVIGQGGNAAGDVTVILENGKYYMFCTGGGAWVSEDMLNWTFHEVKNVPVAPHVIKYNGSFYMCGNDCPVYKADNPLGPYESIGDWKNTPDVEGGWNGAFDVDIFIDDDNQPYLYYPGRGVSGIYVVKLDRNDIRRFDGPVKHLFGFNSDHIWERYGEMNEYTDVAWVEGPWMEKHNGTYYLQYSASGTQWKTYAEGYYTSKSPMGPFTYAPNNPLLRKTEGLITGPAHGSIVEGPDGNLWQFYTIVLSNPPGGRRIGMDRITFDENGNMSVKVTDTPQWAPVAGIDPAEGECNSLPVTINKVVSMNTLSKVSSQKPGREAAYAVDNSSGTWWEPTEDDATPTLLVELSPATRFDVVQLFTIDAARLMFNSGGRWFGRRSAEFVPVVFKYKIDVSRDGENFETVLDMTNNESSKNTIFEEIAPVECRFVRLTITDWPKSSPLGVIEFTVFGKSTGYMPSAVPIPVTN